MIPEHNIRARVALSALTLQAAPRRRDVGQCRRFVDLVERTSRHGPKSPRLRTLRVGGSHDDSRLRSSGQSQGQAGIPSAVVAGQLTSAVRADLAMLPSEHEPASSSAAPVKSNAGASAK